MAEEKIDDGSFNDLEELENEVLNENDEERSKESFIQKISKSEFGKRIITKRVALILVVLLVIGTVLNYARTTISDEAYESYTSFLLAFTEKEFLIFVLIGFVAQMVDGALGMAYGISSNTMLIAYGLRNDVAILSIKLSEVFTTAASGFSHWKMGNVNKKLFKNLIIPGVIGAVAGSFLLAYIDSLENYAKYLKPFISIYILLLGVFLIYKALGKVQKKKKTKKLNSLAVFGGFMDAIGGGGWGPIVTSTLLSSGRNPKYTIGSVNLAEFFVAFSGAATLTWAVGLSGWKVVVGMIIGGIIAAPFGAIIAGKVKAKPLMILIGVLIIIVNSWTIYKAWLK